MTTIDTAEDLIRILRQGDYTPDMQTFLSDIDDALDSSLITERQRDRLVLTDLIDASHSSRQSRSRISRGRCLRHNKPVGTLTGLPPLAKPSTRYIRSRRFRLWQDTAYTGQTGNTLKEYP